MKAHYTMYITKFLYRILKQALKINFFKLKEIQCNV